MKENCARLNIIRPALDVVCFLLLLIYDFIFKVSLVDCPSVVSVTV